MHSSSSAGGASLMKTYIASNGIILFHPPPVPVYTVVVPSFQPLTEICGSYGGVSLLY